MIIISTITATTTLFFLHVPVYLKLNGNTGEKVSYIIMSECQCLFLFVFPICLYLDLAMELNSN